MSAVVKLPRAYKALDMPITFTHFKNLAAQAKPERELTRFRDLVDVIEQTQAPTKAMLPLLSFATYGENRTPKGSYRHDTNVAVIWAISGDHDHGDMTMEGAQNRLDDLGIAAVLHTTPSHTASAPRWRVFCPLAHPLVGEGGKSGRNQHKRLTGVLNSILGGELASESFALSQSYYYGHVEGVEYRTAVVDTGHTLDSPDRSKGLPQPTYPGKSRDDTPDDEGVREPRDNTNGKGPHPERQGGPAGPANKIGQPGNLRRFLQCG